MGADVAQRKIRVLLAVSGHEGQDRVAKTLALALRDAGMEVIFAGLHRMAKQVAAVALQEDVDVVALCVPPAGRLSLPRKLLEALAALGIRDDVKVAVTGAVASRDVSRLRAMGVDGIFPAGTAPGEIAAWLRGKANNGDERGTA